MIFHIHSIFHSWVILSITNWIFSVWFMAGIAIFGNIMVLLGRCLMRSKRHHNIEHDLFLKNLAASDLLMGVYLAIIAFTDISYRWALRNLYQCTNEIQLVNFTFQRSLCAVWRGLEEELCVLIVRLVFEILFKDKMHERGLFLNELRTHQKQLLFLHHMQAFSAH